MIGHESILRQLNTAEVIKLRNRHCISFDFTSNNKELTDEVIANEKSLGRYIDQKMQQNNAQIGFGGYLEHRALYRRSAHFGSEDTARDIHLGIDIWCPADEPVHAPVDALVHSFANNNNYGDYGHTLILEHFEQGFRFYTLYGHLSAQSLVGKTPRQKIAKGEVFATVGDYAENGAWPPHLHFQIIKYMGKKKGDYPGVCHRQELEFFKNNCPDPQLVLPKFNV